jgi:hypothetical protein
VAHGGLDVEEGLERLGEQPTVSTPPLPSLPQPVIAAPPLPPPQCCPAVARPRPRKKA